VTIAAIPCVIYAAKSTEDVRGSIATQLADCRSAIENLTDGGCREVDSEHADEGRSAYRGNRGQGLASAKRAAVAAAADAGGAELWVQHSDRIARGDGLAADHLAEVFFAMRRAGVRLRSVQDDGNLEDVIRVALIGERNTEDSRRKSEAVRAGKRRQFERGERLGGPVPDGYRRVLELDSTGGVSGRYELDPERAAVIARLFELAASGMADANVMRTLNREGHRTKGGHWTRRRVQDTTTNPFYAGRVTRGRATPGAQVESRAGGHPALIDVATFDALQRGRRARDHAAGSPRQPGRPNSRHLLAGLAYCARCAQLMRPRVSTYRRKDGTQARSYLCRHVSDGTGLCDQPVFDAEQVDVFVVEHLRGFIFDYDAWITAISERRDLHRETLAQRRAALQEQLASLTGREHRLTEDYAQHVASDHQARAEIAALALARDRESSGRLRAELRELTAAEARATSDAPGDALLDFHNELTAALAGVLGCERPLLEVNAELRVYFAAFWLNHGPNGQRSVFPTIAPAAGDVMLAALNEALRDGHFDRVDTPFPLSRIFYLDR